VRWAVSAVVIAGLVGGIWVETGNLRAWFLRRSAETVYDEGDIDGALVLYERVKTFLPDEPTSYTDIADTISLYLGSRPGRKVSPEAFKEMVARAARHYLVAIDKGPPNAWSYGGLGALAGAIREERIHREGVDLAELSGDPVLRPEDHLGERAWGKAVQLEPNNFYYRDFLGDFYLRRGFVEHALAHIRVGVRLHPVLDRHYYLSYFATVSPAVLGAVEQGIQDALASDETQVSEYDIHRFLAAIYLRMGRFQDAKTSLEAAAEVAPKPYAVDIQIGQLLAKEGDDDGARIAFQRATERAPDNARAWLHLGMTLSRTGDHDAAVEAARRARGLSPTDFTTLWGLARVLEAAQRLDEAAQVLEGLIQTHGDRQTPYMQLIRIYEKQGKLAAAVRVARVLAARYPDEPVFQEQVEQLQESMFSDL
jgi:tetratricopeptide (TPR) repeat protein